ncbi:MAG: beta strand repeat-containing protein, partial [Pseudohongiellaceae bacterium]
VTLTITLTDDMAANGGGDIVMTLDPTSPSPQTNGIYLVGMPSALTITVADAGLQTAAPTIALADASNGGLTTDLITNDASPTFDLSGLVTDATVLVTAASDAVSFTYRITLVATGATGSVTFMDSHTACEGSFNDGPFNTFAACEIGDPAATDGTTVWTITATQQSPGETVSTEAGPGGTVTIDLGAPTSVSISGDNTADAGADATLTFTFDEAPASFVTTAITHDGGGTFATPTATSTTVYTAVYTAAGSAETVNVSVAAGAYTDVAGNASTTASNTHTIMVTVPAVPTINVADVSVTEPANLGDAATYLEFVVTLNPTSTGVVSFDYVTSDGTAMADEGDYTAITTATNLEFAAGTSVMTISVAVAGDGGYEGDETMSLVLSNPSPANAFGGETSLTATGTILDNDTVPVLELDTSNTTFTLPEGNDTSDDAEWFVNTRTATGSSFTDLDLTINLTFTQSPADCANIVDSGTTTAATSGDRTVTAGEAEFDVTSKPNTTPGDPDCTVTITLAQATGQTNYTLGTATSLTLTITEDDRLASTAPVISTPADNAYVNAGNETALTVSGTATMGAEISVDIAGAVFTAVTDTADTNGDWSVDLDLSSLTDGVITIEVVASEMDRNAATATVSVNKDTVAPGAPVIAGGNSVLVGAGNTLDLTFTFPEPVSGFVAGDIAIDPPGIGNISGLAGPTSMTVYTATYTAPVTGNGGDITLSVGASAYTDAAGNDNTAASAAHAVTVAAPMATQTPVVDLDATSDTGSSDTDNITSDHAPTFTISNLVNGAEVVVEAAYSTYTIRKTLTAGDTTATVGFDPAGGAGGNCDLFNPDGTPGTQNTSECGFAQGSSDDDTNGAWTVTARQTGTAPGNTVSMDATPVVVTLDSVEPSIMLTAESTSLVSGGATAITATASENIVGLMASEITATNGDLTGFAGADDVYTATFTSTSGNDAVIAIADNAYTDIAGNNGT